MISGWGLASYWATAGLQVRWQVGDQPGGVALHLGWPTAGQTGGRAQAAATIMASHQPAHDNDYFMTMMAAMTNLV